MDVKELVNNYNWNSEEKKMIDNIFERLIAISKLRFNDVNKTAFQSKNETKRYPNNNRRNESWRKQKVDSSENLSNKSQQQPFSFKKSLENRQAPVIEPITYQHKLIDKIVKLPLKTPIDEPTKNSKDSNSIETKLKKFENKFSSLENVHVVSLENNSIKKPFSSRVHVRGSNRYNGSRPSWRNQRDVSQNQNCFEIFHNNGINSQRSQGDKNVYLKNQDTGNPKHEFGNHSVFGRSNKDTNDLA